MPPETSARIDASEPLIVLAARGGLQQVLVVAARNCANWARQSRILMQYPG